MHIVNLRAWSNAWHGENLADVVVARKETLGTLDEEPVIKSPTSVCAFRVDYVLVGDTQDIPDSRDLGVVALVVETSMHHSQPKLPRTWIIIAQLRGAMRGLIQRKSAPEVGYFAKCLVVDFKLVCSLGWSSPFLKHAFDEMDVNGAGQHDEDVVLRVSKVCNAHDASSHMSRRRRAGGHSCPRLRIVMERERVDQRRVRSARAPGTL